ncbi:hypothetical protein [Rhodanobacter sp. L36]|uniref:hypothetical protein n=1 Tax=Rhodanobacter sp. L36 TaxID=1747221 RepID=UPI0020B122EE|nr:hypothetical protein [Rhodanobacter sp. L36]
MTNQRFPRAALCLRHRSFQLPHRRIGIDHRYRSARHLALLALIAGSGTSPMLHAQSSTFGGTVAVSSELMDRGQAITGNTPILQAAASWTSVSGWSLGVSAGTKSGSPGRLVEGLAQVSHYWSLSGDWQMQASALYYRYPGSAGVRAYDRAESGVNWTYRDVLTMGVSAIYVLGAKTHRMRGAADLGFHWPLAWNLSLTAGVGVAQALVAPYTRYQYGRTGTYAYLHEGGLLGYGQVGLMWSRGPWRIEVARVMADAATRQQWASLNASPWIGTLSRSF